MTPPYLALQRQARKHASVPPTVHTKDRASTMITVHPLPCYTEDKAAGMPVYPQPHSKDKAAILPVYPQPGTPKIGQDRSHVCAPHTIHQRKDRNHASLPPTRHQRKGNKLASVPPTMHTKDGAAIMSAVYPQLHTISTDTMPVHYTPKPHTPNTRQSHCQCTLHQTPNEGVEPLEPLTHAH